MALTRAEISRRYRERHPERYRASMARANAKRSQWIRKQKEIERLSRLLESETQSPETRP